jgi:hypothetical protein
MHPVKSFTPRQIRALSVEADVAEATVKRRLSGLPLRPSTSARLDKAAKRMGVKLPEAGAWESTSQAQGQPESETA